MKNITDDELKKIVEETIGNNDPYFNEPVLDVVRKIIKLPEGTEITVNQLLGDTYTRYTKFMFEIDNSVAKVCEKLNIILDKSKHAEQEIGLPFNISFIKKTLSDEIVNSIPETLKDFFYIYNGNIYAKQKLPIELEKEYEELMKKINKD